MTHPSNFMQSLTLFLIVQYIILSTDIIINKAQSSKRALSKNITKLAYFTSSKS